jgi:hypothetical protein
MMIAPLPTSVCSKLKPQTEPCAPLGNRIQIANNWTRWRGIFKGLSQDGRADFSEDLRCSLFNADLSNEPILSARSISLDCTYLCAKEKLERIRPEDKNEFVEKIKQN